MEEKEEFLWSLDAWDEFLDAFMVPRFGDNGMPLIPDKNGITKIELVFETSKQTVANIYYGDEKVTQLLRDQDTEMPMYGILQIKDLLGLTEVSQKVVIISTKDDWTIAVYQFAPTMSDMESVFQYLRQKIRTKTPDLYG